MSSLVWASGTWNAISEVSSDVVTNKFWRMLAGRRVRPSGVSGDRSPPYSATNDRPLMNLLLVVLLSFLPPATHAKFAAAECSSRSAIVDLHADCSILTNEYRVIRSVYAYQLNRFCWSSRAVFCMFFLFFVPFCIIFRAPWYDLHNK